MNVAIQQQPKLDRTVFESKGVTLKVINLNEHPELRALLARGFARSRAARGKRKG
jgi:hypothetical protein